MDRVVDHAADGSGGRRELGQEGGILGSHVSGRDTDDGVATSLAMKRIWIIVAAKRAEVVVSGFFDGDFECRFPVDHG